MTRTTTHPDASVIFRLTFITQTSSIGVVDLNTNAAGPDRLAFRAARPPIRDEAA